MKNNPQFYAPSIEETNSALSAELQQEFAAIVETLEQRFGPLTQDFNLLGWVWVQASLAERVGITEPQHLLQGLEQGYQELQNHLS